MGNAAICCSNFVSGQEIKGNDEVLSKNNNMDKNPVINNNNENNSISGEDSKSNNNNKVQRKGKQSTKPLSEIEIKLNNNINSIISTYNNKLNENSSQNSHKNNINQNNQQSTNKNTTESMKQRFRNIMMKQRQVMVRIIRWRSKTPIPVTRSFR